MYRRSVTDGSLALLGLTAIRMVLGAFWLSQLMWKLPPGFGCPDDGFCFWLSREIEHPSSPLYGTFLTTVVAQHPYVFAWFAVILESVVGVSLLLGLYTRLGGLLGTLWSVNLFVALTGVPGETNWYYLSLVLLDLLFFAIGGSAQLSIDRVTRSRSWWAQTD
jgi:uncharacterized membrane protein YphA (DoxX/SURF4 family)